MYGATAAIFMEGNPISRRKNRFFADFTAGSRRLQVKSVGGVVVAGEKFPRPPACQKYFFDRLKRAADEHSRPFYMLYFAASAPSSTR